MPPIGIDASSYNNNGSGPPVLDFNWQDVQHALDLGSTIETPSVQRTREEDLPSLTFGTPNQESRPEPMPSFMAPPLAELDTGKPLDSTAFGFLDPANSNTGTREIVPIPQDMSNSFSSPSATEDFFTGLNNQPETSNITVLQDYALLPSVTRAPEAPAAPRVNSALARIIGNLAMKGDANIQPVQQPPLRQLSPVATGSGKHAIGLTLAEEEETISEETTDDAPEQPAMHQEISLATTDQPAPTPYEAMVVPVDAPFHYVSSNLRDINHKYDSTESRYSRTLRPDGTAVEVQTAADFSSMTRTHNLDGSNLMVVHDKYRRPQFEQSTNADGTWSFSEIRYHDQNGRINPFPQEKLSVFSDGSMTRFRFSSMGLEQTRDNYPVG